MNRPDHRRTTALFFLMLLISSTVTPAWFTTNANLTMRDRLTVGTTVPQVSIFNDGKRAGAAAVATILAILINHMAQAAANELMASGLKSLPLSKKQILKNALRATVTPRKLSNVGLFSLSRIFKKDLTRSASSTLSKRLYAWIRTNKVFTVLSCAELAAALYFILNKDGELAHYREWKQLAAELASEIKKYSLNANATFADVHKYRIFVSDVLKVDMSAADANIKLAAARISFGRNVLEVDMDAKDADAQFAKALAEFESLARFSPHTTGSVFCPLSLSSRRKARATFGYRTLGVDMTAVDAEKQFAAALAEYDALEKEGITSDTLESRRTIKGFNDVVRAQVAVLLVDGALPASATRPELEHLLHNYQTLRGLKTSTSIQQLSEEQIASLLDFIKKLNPTAKATLSLDLETWLMEEPQARSAAIKAFGAGITDSSTIDDIKARLNEMLACPKTWHSNPIFQQTHAQLATKMLELVRQESARQYPDMPVELREVIQCLRFFGLPFAQDRKKDLTRLHATHGTSPDYAQAMQLVDDAIAKLQDAAEKQKQDIARQENLKIGELVTFTDRQTYVEYHAQVVGINPDGSRVFETDPKKFIAPALLPQNQALLRAELHRQQEATRGALVRLLGGALPQPSGVVKLEVHFTDSDPERQDVLFVEGDNLPDANSDEYNDDTNIWWKGRAYFIKPQTVQLESGTVVEMKTKEWGLLSEESRLVEVPATAI